MSRIGKEPVKLADGVTATVSGQTVTVKGKLGELSYTMHEGITAKVEDGSVVVYVEEELPPDPRGALNDDPGYPMGIVVTNSFYYDARGNQQGFMPGGTVIETLETKDVGGKMVDFEKVVHDAAFFRHRSDRILDDFL